MWKREKNFKNRFTKINFLNEKRLTLFLTYSSRGIWFFLRVIRNSDEATRLDESDKVVSVGTVSDADLSPAGGFVEVPVQLDIRPNRFGRGKVTVLTKDEILSFPIFKKVAVMHLREGTNAGE